MEDPQHLSLWSDYRWGVGGLVPFDIFLRCHNIQILNRYSKTLYLGGSPASLFAFAKSYVSAVLITPALLFRPWGKAWGSWELGCWEEGSQGNLRSFKDFWGFKFSTELNRHGIYWAPGLFTNKAKRIYVVFWPVLSLYWFMEGMRSKGDEATFSVKACNCNAYLEFDNAWFCNVYLEGLFAAATKF